MRLEWTRRCLARKAVGKSVTWFILPATEEQTRYDVFAIDKRGTWVETGEHQFPSARQAKRYCQEQEEQSHATVTGKEVTNGEQAEMA